MGKVRTIARRTFLIGSTAIAGGVAFGVYLTKRPHDNPLLEDLADGEAAFNPWVKIDADGITLITPHVDIGQGAISMQAALIAEEMDLDWGQFNTDYGQPAAAYYNRALGAELAPFNKHEDSRSANAVRGLLHAVTKIAGLQGTGGSSSVPDSFTKLREAGAIARETLKLAAARRSGVAVGELRTDAGAVLLPNGERLAYTALAADAATIEPVTDVTLRDPSEWRLIGKPMQRLDIVGKSTGTQRYGIDIEHEGMQYAAVRTNPRQGGDLISYDDTAARALPGVTDIVRLGNGVAALANNTWNAFKAVNAIDIEWGPAPYPAEMGDHWAAVSASFNEDTLDKQWRDDGDVDSAQGDAVTAEYRAPYVAHQPLEPLNAMVIVNNDGAEVWASHQFPRFVQQVVADVAGCATDAVTFHNQHGGGSFGHRLEFENIRQATEIAAQMPGTPVKLTFTREEDFAHDFPRQIGMARGAGRVADGKVVSLDLAIATPSSSTSQTQRIGQPAPPGPDEQIVAGAWNAPYAIPNCRVRGYRVPELAPVSSWRSVGASTAGFFMETFLDELIHAAGADPMEERLRLIDRAESRAVLEAVAELSNWGAPLGVGRGRGVALVDSFGVPVAEVVEVSETDAGIRIDNVYVAADVGRIVDPINFENHVKGAVVWGLGHAMNCEITYADGQAEQRNFHQHSGMRIHQCPNIVVRGLELANKIRGIGEPPVPPAAPALANAIFSLTGERLREMPFDKTVKFVS
ncbi:MAG: molybdopterin cofactor-binding domain-containing protein [Pseudomonadota bacterium]